MRRFILGTDWWTDCDDAVALRMLTRAHRAGEIRLLGIALNGCTTVRRGFELLLIPPIRCDKCNLE